MSPSEYASLLPRTQVKSTLDVLSNVILRKDEFVGFLDALVDH